MTDGTLRAEGLPVEPTTDARAGRRRSAAILAALLLHLAAIATLVDRLPLEPPPQPAPIPVELAYAPPEPPPEEKPPAQQQPVPDRRSGGDLEHAEPGTPPATAEAPTPPPTPPVADTPPPTATPVLPDQPSEQSLPVPPPAPLDTQQAVVAPPVPPKKPAVPAVAVPPPAPPQIATPPPDADLQLGPGGGDRYLNAAKARILRHLVYPPTAELFRITGMAIYEIVINRQGELLDVRLAKSAGSDILDNAGFQTIRMSAPFDPVPDDIPGSRIGLILELSMGPKR